MYDSLSLIKRIGLFFAVCVISIESVVLFYDNSLTCHQQISSRNKHNQKKKKLRCMALTIYFNCLYIDRVAVNKGNDTHARYMVKYLLLAFCFSHTIYLNSSYFPIAWPKMTCSMCIKHTCGMRAWQWYFNLFQRVVVVGVDVGDDGWLLLWLKQGEKNCTFCSLNFVLWLLIFKRSWIFILAQCLSGFIAKSNALIYHKFSTNKFVWTKF